MSMSIAADYDARDIRLRFYRIIRQKIDERKRHAIACHDAAQNDQQRDVQREDACRKSGAKPRMWRYHRRRQH